MNEDEDTNATVQGVPSEDRSDDGDGADVETDGTVGESNAETKAERADSADDVDGEPTDEREEAGDEDDTVEELRAELAEAESEIDELEGRLKRKQADFQNYKKRAKKRQQQIKDRATEDLVERLVGVRDNLKRALEEESDDVESLRGGVRMTMQEFDRVLADEDVAEIDPDPGTEADPQRHEVMMQVDSPHPEGTIAEVYTPGYEMGEKVIQNAQVTVSNGELEDDGSEE
jgi:molecular chaperone GrpE